MTACTPGTARAREVSTLSTRAWACGDRTTAPYSMRGNRTSPTNWDRPLILSMTSTRRTDVPMMLAGRASRIAGSVRSGVANGALQPVGQLDRVDDRHVAGAAAEVPVHGGPDLLVGRVGVLVQQRTGGHDVAGGAEPALETGLREEGLLDRVELLPAGETLDRAHLATVHQADH